MSFKIALLLALSLHCYGLSTTVYADDTAPSLSMPLVCTVGVDCFIQNYVDADDSSHYGDYHCGFLSYDEHRGTDFRPKTMISLATEIPVLAAADGVVRAVRDGMDDINVKVHGRKALQGKDAGNSVVIVHGNNWESQYAHLKKGSVTVQAGQMVKRGTVLGQVGLSGNTEFFHLHFEIRHQGKAIDPFIGISGSDACSTGKQPLWSKDTLTKIPYIATEVLAAGFIDYLPKDTAINDTELTEVVTLPANAPALVFAITLFGVQAGDEQVVEWIAPNGKVLLHKVATIDKNMAQHRLFMGKKRSLDLWSTGDYRVNYQLLRKQKSVLSKQFSLHIF
jgi:murein DD-endopeptidase MepM/ murein hydrolase activator NlpD